MYWSPLVAIVVLDVHSETTKTTTGAGLVNTWGKKQKSLIEKHSCSDRTLTHQYLSIYIPSKTDKLDEFKWLKSNFPWPRLQRRRWQGRNRRNTSRIQTGSTLRRAAARKRSDSRENPINISIISQNPSPPAKTRTNSHRPSHVTKGPKQQHTNR